jgi:dienelactone hydrolase
MDEKHVKIPSGEVELLGDLVIPDKAKAIIVFVHGSGSSRFSSRNRFVAQYLQKKGFATLLMDLLTKKEEEIDDITGELRFNILFLAERVKSAVDWVKKNTKLKIALFGASTGAAAALICAAENQKLIYTVVSRGGRPDMAEENLPDIKSPTLLIVGGDDTEVIELNEFAFERLKCIKKIEIVPGATHLFEEPGKLEKVADIAANWFKKYL